MFILCAVRLRGLNNPRNPRNPHSYSEVCAVIAIATVIASLSLAKCCPVSVRRGF